MSEVHKIASRHLGNKGEYQHYDKVDPSLLVAIPRALSRADSNVTVKMSGYDVWNCYEFSCLRFDGVPVSGRVKLAYSSDSEFLVESKSLKLYMNSWNFMVTNDVNNEKIAEKVGADIRTHLEEVLKTSVDVTVHFDLYDDMLDMEPVSPTGFKNLDKIHLKTPMDYTDIKESTSYLKSAVTHINGHCQKLYSQNLRSNCRITSQPDWSDVFIQMEGPNGVDEESLLKYLLSLRKQDHFHEECCEMILNDLYKAFKPTRLSVVCLYTRRGGIDINPVRWKGGTGLAHPEFRNTELTFKKTFRQ